MDINLLLDKLKQQVYKEINIYDDDDDDGINPIPICCEDNKIKKSLSFLEITNLMNELKNNKLQNKIKNIIDLTEFAENNKKNIDLKMEEIMNDYRNYYLCEIKDNTKYIIENLAPKNYLKKHNYNYCIIFNLNNAYIIYLQNKIVDIKNKLIESINLHSIKDDIADINDIMEELTTYFNNNSIIYEDITEKIENITKEYKINVINLSKDPVKNQKTKKFETYMKKLEEIMIQNQSIKNKYFLCRYTLFTFPFISLYHNIIFKKTESATTFNTLLMTNENMKIILTPGKIKKNSMKNLIERFFDDKTVRECPACLKKVKKQIMCTCCFQNKGCLPCIKKMQKNMNFRCPLCNNE
jgi:hypothetical protein